MRNLQADIKWRPNRFRAEAAKFAAANDLSASTGALEIGALPGSVARLKRTREHLEELVHAQGGQ